MIPQLDGLLLVDKPPGRTSHDLQFSKFLRPIQKFDSADTLAAQIQKDISVVIKSSH